MKSRPYLKILASSLTIVLLTGLVFAQRGTSVVRRITFARGRTSAVLRGTIKRGTSHDYLLKARVGQGMAVHLSSPGDVGFEILTPSGQSLSGYTRDWSGYLPEYGDYRINVLPPTTTNAPTRYTLEVMIR
jgi:hypothetical protein